jgi:hypothetical protein
VLGQIDRSRHQIEIDFMVDVSLAIINLDNRE